MRKLLAVILFILEAAIIAGVDSQNPAEAGPHLISSSVQGRLEIDRPGTIWIEIRNDANGSTANDTKSGQEILAWFGRAYRANLSDAMGISAQLRSGDGRIRMLSGPQPVGRLSSKESRSIEFRAIADGFAEPGVYPAELVLTYIQLSALHLAGDQAHPVVSFVYENATLTIPVDVEVALGPRISVGEARDLEAPGRESDLSLSFINRGDEPAFDLSVTILPQPPIRSSEGAAELGTLEPGGMAWAKFRIYSVDGIPPDYYALPIRASFMDDGILRNEELAAVVTIKSQSWIGLMLKPAASALLIASGLCLGWRIFKGRAGKRKWRRW